MCYNIGNLSVPDCDKCGKIDSNSHRIKECPNAKVVWEWSCSIVQNRFYMNVVDLEEILQLDLDGKSEKHRAGLWLAVKTISFNLKVSEPSLFVLKKEIRELRWNQRKKFKDTFGTMLNIC